MNGCSGSASSGEDMDELPTVKNESESNLED